MLLELHPLPLSLNPRQRAFVKAILRGDSPTAAAACAGYSKHSARQQASRLLQRDDIAETIQQANDRRRRALADVERARTLALENHDHHAAIAATELQRSMIHVRQ